jgi:hypothetical protein
MGRPWHMVIGITINGRTTMFCSNFETTAQTGEKELAIHKQTVH